MPVAVVFLLRAVVLILLWAFVIAAVVAVRHDIYGTKTVKPIAAAPVHAARPAPAAKPARKPDRSAPATHVVVIEGTAAGTAVALSSLPLTIGRAPSSAIVLADDYVSNNHARLVPRGTDWLIEDTGSTNGTTYAGRKVTTPVVVPVGGRITIGRNVLELR